MLSDQERGAFKVRAMVKRDLRAELVKAGESRDPTEAEVEAEVSRVYPWAVKATA